MKVNAIKDDFDYKETLWDKISYRLRYVTPFDKLFDFGYYIRNVFIRKHHIIKTGLKKGQWYDSEMRILYGMMNLLTEYIEGENPFDIIDWDSDDEHRHARDEMVSIKEWWDEYPNRELEIDKSLNDWHSKKFEGVDRDGWLDRINEGDTEEHKRLFDIHNELCEKLFEEEQDMLIRLIKIRPFLWT